jgi:hypothetical protein
MFPFPFSFTEWERELRILFYNVGTAFPEGRRSRNVERGNRNVGHVPVPGLLRSGVAGGSATVWQLSPLCKPTYITTYACCCMQITHNVLVWHISWTGLLEDIMLLADLCTQIVENHYTSCIYSFRAYAWIMIISQYCACGFGINCIHAIHRCCARVPVPHLKKRLITKIRLGSFTQLMIF